MPCRDYDYDAMRASENKRRLDTMAAQLCRAMKLIEETGNIRNAGITPNMRKWWEEHKQCDRDRRKEEKRKRAAKMRRKRALRKLTEADKRALGVD